MTDLQETGPRDVKASQEPSEALTKGSAFGEISDRNIRCDCHHWDLREPRARGMASLLQSLIPLCPAVSSLWFTEILWEIMSDIFQSQERISHLCEDCWEAGKTM